MELAKKSWRNHRFIRVSIQGYNSPSDIERLMTALQAIFSSGEQVSTDSKM